MKLKASLLVRLPGIRWSPHDIDSSEPSSSASPSKPKPRIPFSLRSSAPDTAILRPRKSSLKPSSAAEPNVRIDARTRAQNQALFFARLPLELRHMVYEYVMGGEVLHLTLSTKRRFGHCICDEGREDEEHNGNSNHNPNSSSGATNNSKQCACRVLVGGRKDARRLDGGGVSLARTCRRM